MAKFHGKIGYAQTVETAPGVYEEEITERFYYGDISRTSRALRVDAQVNSALTLGNSISIVADAYANGQFFAIRYVEWGGERWTVIDVEVQPPRLLLRLGEVYNGLTAEASGTS
jgi:hypothetical protein